MCAYIQQFIKKCLLPSKPHSAPFDIFANLFATTHDDIHATVYANLLADIYAKSPTTKHTDTRKYIRNVADNKKQFRRQRALLKGTKKTPLAFDKKIIKISRQSPRRVDFFFALW